MRVAIVHDWLNGMRGGEKVLESLLAMFHQPTIYTLFHEPGKVSRFIELHEIVTSWLNRIPGIYRIYRNLLPLFPKTIEAFDFTGYDLVLSSSHAVAKGIRPQGALHICYCHTPMRYIWDAEQDYQLRFPSKLAFRCFRSSLRRWDRESAKRVDHFIANSNFVRDRIRRYYNCESEVVSPPIDTDFFTTTPELPRDDIYLAAGALVPYKRFDIAIRAFNMLGKRLIVAGDGPELNRLRKLAAANVNVCGRVSNEELRRLFRTAKALVYTAREDFGMIAVEAQACGCPVVAYAAGGLTEIVSDGVNGLLFEAQNEDQLIRAIERCEQLPWAASVVSQGVERFSRGAFKRKIEAILANRAIPIARTPEQPAPLH